MSTSVLFNGSTYTIPAEGESNWGTNVSNYLIAVASGTLQKTGGTFTLSSELDFGTTYGLKTPYIKSRATNPSGAGIFRLGNAESIGWRNAGNTADLLLKANASDNLEYNGTKVTLSGAIVNADIAAGAAIDYSKLALIATNKVLISDGSGYLTASSVTSTTLTYLDATSSIQTQINGKEPSFSVLSIAKGGTNSSTALSNNKVMISSAGAISESSVTTTTLGYLDATSSIQTQLNGKQATGSYALTTGKLSQFAATTSAELAGVISDETGSGSLVFNNTPTFTTPVLGDATGTSLALGSTLNASAIVDLTSTSLGFLEPRMTQTQRDAISTPATGLQVYNTTSNKLNYYNGTAWKEAGGVGTWAASTAYAVGDLVLYGQAVYSCLTAHTSSSTMETDLAGTSPKWVIVNKQPLSQNLMTFGADFECGDTSGWTACGCATVTNGLLASVGSGGAIFSSSNGGRAKGANTTSPAVVSSGQLDGSYSLNFATSGAGTIGDMYISSAYKIPIAFQSTVLQVKFKYKVISGTPVMAGTSSNTYACAIYDVDNNSWMPLVGAFNFVQSSGVGTFTGTTQVPYNSTQFQIAIYNPIAPTGASSLYVDDFYVGPQGIDSSSSVVATNVYRASTQSLTNATAQKIQFATINFDNGNCYDNVTNYRYTAKTPGVYLINTQVVFAGNASNIRITMIYKNGSEIFRTHSNTNILAQSTYLPATYSVNLAAYDYIEVYAYQDTGAALNVGGSNTTYLSVQLVTSPSGLINSGVNACCVVNSGATTQTLTTSSSKITTLNTAISDPTGMYDSTNDRIYAYVAGQYRVSSSLRAESLAAGRRMTAQIYHTSGGSSTIYDAGELANPDAANAVIGVAVATLILTMKAGDYVELYGKVDSGTTAAGAYGLTNLTLERLSGPAVIAATETVAARYTNTSGSAVANTETVLDFPTKDYDSHNAVTTGASFKFTAPISGLFLVTVNCLTAPSATASSLVGRIRKNGTAFKSTVFPRFAAVSTYLPLVIQSEVRLLGGEYVDFVLNETVDTNTLDTTAGANSFEVVRTGNYV